MKWRKDLNDDGPILMAIIILLLIIAGILGYYSYKSAKQCTERGGVYLQRDGVCIKKEIIT